VEGRHYTDEVALIDNMTRKYTASPIVEAIFELRYDPQYWDVVMPGRFDAALSGEFPKRQEVKAVNFTFKPGEPAPSQEETPVVRFLSADGRDVVQIGPGMAAVSRLRPYGSWEHFKAAIARMVSLLEEQFSDKGTPAGYGLALRYINRIAVKQDRQAIERVIHLSPKIPEQLSDPMPLYHLQMQRLLTEPSGVLLLATGLTPPVKDGLVSLMLDIIVQSGTKQIARAATLGWAELAHNEIERAFEMSITEEVRTQFENGA